MRGKKCSFLSALSCNRTCYRSLRKFSGQLESLKISIDSSMFDALKCLPNGIFITDFQVIAWPTMNYIENEFHMIAIMLLLVRKIISLHFSFIFFLYLWLCISSSNSCTSLVQLNSQNFTLSPHSMCSLSLSHTISKMKMNNRVEDARKMFINKERKNGETGVY